MGAKIAVVLLSGKDNPGRAMAGLHVAKRMYDAREANGLEDVEVFLFTEGVRMVGEPNGEWNQVIRELLEAGVLVGACANQLNSWNLAEVANTAGVQAEFARDAFSRYARDGYTVLTF